MLDAAPLPVSATFHPATQIAVVTFDKPLVNGFSNALDWLLYYQLEVAPTAANATVLGNTVTVHRSDLLMTTEEPDRIKFFGTQHDLFGTNGLEVQPFQIPYTVI